MKSVSRVIFFRSLATMLAAGIRIHKALQLLARTGDDRKMQEVAFNLAQRVASGEDLARAMVREGKAFSLFHIRMVSIGFEAGGLDKILVNLAEYEEARRRDGMKLAGALIYPAFVFAICLLMLLVAPSTVLSGQFELLQGMNIAVPKPMLALRDFSAFLCSWPGLLTLAVVGALVWRVLKKHVTNERLYRVADRMPGLAGTLEALALTRFARSMTVQIRAGLMPLQAIEQAAETSGHPRLMANAPKGTDALRNGADLRSSLARIGFFPRSFLEVLRAGEATGKVENMMEWLADIYQEEFEGRLESALAALQPLVLMGTGIVTASVLLTTMLPMVRAIQTL